MERSKSSYHKANKYIQLLKFRFKQNEDSMDGKNNKKPSKKSYVKPSIKSEKLLSYGALCNGQKKGGRKSTAGAPDFCSTAKLLS